MRALVVDDSGVMRSVLRLMLKESGFDVTEAKHGKEGLEALRDKGPFDVAMLDWNMPEMGGLELLREIRRDAAFDSMRVVMVTTETDLQQVQNALLCGANEYVMKPFDRGVILDKLHLLGF